MMSTSTHSKVVVLTGSIGTGKSTVADLLKQLGATIVSADELARQAVAKGWSVRDLERRKAKLRTPTRRSSINPADPVTNAVRMAAFYLPLARRKSKTAQTDVRADFIVSVGGINCLAPVPRHQKAAAGSKRCFQPE